MLNDPWSQEVLREIGLQPDDASFYPVPVETTEAGKRFFWDLRHTLEVVVLMSEAAVFADNAALVAAKINSGARDLPKDFNPKIPLTDRPGPFRRRLFGVSSVVFELLLVRLSDNFTTYLSEVIRECLLARPEVLRSSETITFELALRCESIEELQKALINRKVDELAYLGFTKLAEWLSSRLGVSQLANAPARFALIEVLEARNCLVHNRGMASEKFTRAAVASDLKVGDRIPIELDTLSIAARATAECVGLLDEALALKFRLIKTRAADQPVGGIGGG